MDEVSEGSLLQDFVELLNFLSIELKDISENGYSIAPKFAFDNDHKHLHKEVFS